MREITSHRINGLNDQLRVGTIDEPGNGGAHHEYQIVMPAGARLHKFSIDTDGSSLVIPLQKGPISEAGINGLTNEILIAIVIDRLQCFQKGQFSCRENAIALTKLEEAMHWLQHRTRERLARGVEGTSAKLCSTVL